MQALGYLELKLAWELFQKGPETLSEHERNRLDEVARRQDSIEQRILSSPLAASIIVPQATLEQRLNEIRQRYPSTDDMTNDIKRSGLNAESLARAVERDLKIDTILDKVASTVSAVTEVEAEIYYRLHPEAFDRPESRKLRHILITFDNPAEKSKALDTLESLRASVKNRFHSELSEAFGRAALCHSQCPTAMDGGLLGIVKRNQLYTELEPAAFALAEGEISQVIESPIGLHILYCEDILPSGLLPFAEVRSKIVERLTDKRRREVQRRWIKEPEIFS